MIRLSWLGLFFQICSCLGYLVQNNNLISTVALYRHGDRAPLSLYPNDPYAAEASTIWPEGLGQLSKIGKQQQYALGKWLRTRYDGYLPANYYYANITVYSSGEDRCLMSAAANLAGLYPPQGEEVWNPSLIWQPIPIHNKPKQDDNMLHFGKSCPKYEVMYDDLMRTEHFQRILEDNKELLEYLSVNTGCNVSDFTSLNRIFNTLRIEQLYNLTLPEWTREVFNDDLKFLVDSLRSRHTYTPEMALIRSGRLVDTITTYFEESLVNTMTTPKLLMFSAHDDTIADLLNSLNIFDNHSPEYASTILLELRHAEGRPYVNILYKKGTQSNEVVELTLDDCLFDCNMDKFQEIVRPIRADSTTWELACKLDT